MALTQDRDQFRSAMSSFPSGATIVTTADASGHWWGFTASAFCSVSMDPPLVLACVADTAECYPVFAAAQRWNIHIIPGRHRELAIRFATRGADKFAEAGFEADADGIPILHGVSAALRCSAHSKVVAGDHLVLIAEVEEIDLGHETPVVYFRRNFHALSVDAEAR